MFKPQAVLVICQAFILIILIILPPHLPVCHATGVLLSTNAANVAQSFSSHSHGHTVPEVTLMVTQRSHSWSHSGHTHGHTVHLLTRWQSVVSSSAPLEEFALNIVCAQGVVTFQSELLPITPYQDFLKKKIQHE